MLRFDSMSDPGRTLVAMFAISGCGPSIVVDADTEATSASSAASGEVTSGIGSEATAPGPSTDATNGDLESGFAELEGGLDTSTGTGNDGPTIDPPVQLFEMVRVVEGAPWEIIQDTGGIAVDPNERVFIADGITVYMVEDGIVTPWLEAADGISSPMDVDVDENGLLYVIDMFDRRVVQSSAAHELEVLVDVPQLSTPINLGVLAPGQVAIRSLMDGLWTATAAGAEPLFGERELMGASGCATEELAVSLSGVFVYQPGCNGSPMVMGTLDGTELWLSFESDFGAPGSYTNSLCSTRAPGGGFYAALQFDISTHRLVYVEEDAGNGGGWGYVETSPTYAELEQLTNETFGFRYCGIAVSSSSTLYFQTSRELWVGTPLQ